MQLISELAKTEPRTLYLSSDGGRTPDEHILVESIRESVIDAVNWDCDVHTNFGLVNLGCKYSVHQGVQWFFGCVSEGIVLEDDCIPSSAFFDYATEMLHSYRGVRSIATIGARNEVPQFNLAKPVYCSKFFCWGWASWADRILGIDVEVGYKKNPSRKFYGTMGFYESLHVRGMRQLMAMNLVNSWAYAYDFSFRINHQLHILPPYNYINNIGMSDGEHSKHSIRRDDHLISTEPAVIESVYGNPTKTNGYIEKYLLQKYGYIKLFLFPWIGYIKRIRRVFFWSR
jgi:hypothetical protein